MKTTAVIDVGSKFPRAIVDAEWGWYEIESAMDFYWQTANQLLYYLRNDRSQNPTMTKQEVDAVVEMLGLQSERTALAVIGIRRLCKQLLGFEAPFASVNQTLKEQNYWPVPEVVQKITIDFASYMNIKERQ